MSLLVSTINAGLDSFHHDTRSAGSILIANAWFFLSSLKSHRVNKRMKLMIPMGENFNKVILVRSVDGTGVCLDGEISKVPPPLRGVV